MPQPQDHGSSLERDRAHPERVERGRSSYDQPAEYISVDQYNAKMRLVRLQMSIPLSVLIALGTCLICGLVIHPDIAEISRIHPTLLTPNAGMVAGYVVVVFALQIGFCLVLSVASGDYTKDTLVHGVGMRLALVNWLIAAWAVCWLFRTAWCILVLDLIMVLSIHFTLLAYPAGFMHPFSAIFVHAPTTLLLALMLGLGWMVNGFVAQDWIIEHRKDVVKWKWQAVGVVAGTNFVAVLWEFFTRQYVMAIAFEYMLLCLIFSTPRINPSIPSNPITKPAPYLITIIVCLVVHPFAVIAGFAFHRYRHGDPESRGRILLEEDEEEAHPPPPSSRSHGQTTTPAAAASGDAAASSANEPTKPNKSSTKPGAPANPAAASAAQGEN